MKLTKNNIIELVNNDSILTIEFNKNSNCYYGSIKISNTESNRLTDDRTLKALVKYYNIVNTAIITKFDTNHK